MDVRCERCRAQYVFDDDQVTPSGLTVQCTNCGHVFKVKKKELIVTVPVKPDELDGAPLPAAAAASRPPAHLEAAPARATEPERREWRVRQANGNVFTFRELTTLQKWIVEQKVSRDDEISQGTDAWKRLGNIAELASFFQVVEAAGRAKAQPAVTPPPGSASTTAVFGAPAARVPPPPSGFPPPSFTRPAPARPAPPVASPPAPAPLPADDVPDDEDLAAVRGTGRGRILAVVALVAVAGALAYVLAPRARRAPLALSVPITLEVKPASEAVPPAPGPVSGPAVAAGEAAAATPVAAAAPSTAPSTPPGAGSAEPGGGPPPAVAPVAAPEPVPEQAPQALEPVKAPAKPAATPKALLAQAERLRERGEAGRALDLYGRVVAAEPENAGALVGRGLCYLDLEQYAPAEASFQAALQAAPGQADALMGLAETYRGRGKKAEALQYYERYLALHPDGEEAAVARNAIEELRR